MMIHPLRIILPFSFVWFLLSRFTVAQGNENVECKQRANSSETEWFGKKSPCLLLQKIMQKCDSTYQLPALPNDPKAAVCASWFENPSGSRGAPATNGSTATREFALSQCCCNSVVYSLTQACWSCQQGKNETAFPMQRPTYGLFVQQCGAQTQPTDAVTASLAEAGVDVPGWAKDKYDSNDMEKVWTFESALDEQLKEQKRLNFEAQKQNGTLFGENEEGNGGKNKGKKGNSEINTVLIAVLASVGSFLVAIIAALTLFWCLRRRHKLKQDPDLPYPDLEKSQPYRRTSQASLIPHNPWLESFHSRRSSKASDSSDLSPSVATPRFATPSEAGDLAHILRGGRSDYDADSRRSTKAGSRWMAGSEMPSITRSVPPTPSIHINGAASVDTTNPTAVQRRPGIPVSPHPVLRRENDMDISDALTVADSVITRPDRRSDATFGGMAVRMDTKI